MGINSPKRDFHRRSIRYGGYDYSVEGVYFITLITQQRELLFGNVIDAVMHFNDFGRIAREEWFKTPLIRREIRLEMDEVVIMPNHLHGIVHIVNSGVINEMKDESPEGTGVRSFRYPLRAYVDGKGDRPVALTRSSGPPNKSLGAFVAGYESAVTTRINSLRGTHGQPVWLRNYYYPSRFSFASLRSAKITKLGGAKTASHHQLRA